ncbi:MAG TPA: hypothetical protein VM030_02690 [Acidimicrobiales bacterium]|nr:hypothetical protein [Acidimicrobiales bacterium]
MPSIENLLLANHAEAQNGLLYLVGAGWTDVHRPVLEGGMPPTHLGIGLSVLVGWTETNRIHRVLVYIEPEDGGEPLLRAEADIEVGRPPGALEGADQRASMAISGEVVFPAAGGYSLVCEVGESETRRVSFRVHDQPLA